MLSRVITCYHVLSLVIICYNLLSLVSYHLLSLVIICYHMLLSLVSYHLLSLVIICYHMFEGSLEVKLPTIWRDEKQSRAEAQRRGRLEERRLEEKE